MRGLVSFISLLAQLILGDGENRCEGPVAETEEHGRNGVPNRVMDRCD